MKYTSRKDEDFIRALHLEKSQAQRIRNAIDKAYDNQLQSIDEINAFVAPYIKTPEEAFLAATLIMGEIFEAMQKVSAKLN